MDVQNQKKITFRKKFFLVSLQLAVVGILGFVAMVFMEYTLDKSDARDMALQPQRENFQSLETSLDPTSARVLGEEDVEEGGQVIDLFSEPGEVVLTSENFVMKQITVGGEVALEAGGGDEEKTALEIMDVKSELVKEKNSGQNKLLISWKTSKAALSEVEYAKKGEETLKKVKEERYGYSHTVMLPMLAPSSVYTYVVRCKDYWNNERVSDRFVFYTGAPEVSLMKVLEDATRNVFGWAMGD